jgi:hypothetical protein
MKIIFNSGVVTCIVGDQVYTKQGIDKEFLKVLEECQTDEEVRDLMQGPEVSTSPEEKVEISDWDKFVDFYYNKVIQEFNQSPKRYYIYKNSNGVVKLAKDILLKSKSFKEANNEVLGNVQELFENKMNKSIENRVINI